MNRNTEVFVALIVCLFLCAGCVSAPASPAAPENQTAPAIAEKFVTRQDANSIRNYPAASSPGSSLPVPDTTTEMPDDRPITEKLIRENVVPVETARDQVRARLWGIVADRPDSFASRSWRNASISKGEPVVIEDFAGRKLYYVFGVGREGRPVSDIIVNANKGLFSHPRGLETSAGEYDLVGATRKAYGIAAQDFPGSDIRSVRPIYSLNDNCCHNVTVLMELENRATHEKDRIYVDTYTLESTVGTVSGQNETGMYPSLFSTVTPRDFADNSARWEKENAKSEDLTVFAQKSGIRLDEPLSNPDIITLGTHLFQTDTLRVPHVFDLVHPASGPRPTLEARIQAWHDRADWFSGIYVDAEMSEAQIFWTVKGYTSSDYRLRIFPIQYSSGSYSYCLTVPEEDYDRIFSILKEDGSVFNYDPDENRDLIQAVKRENGTIRLPLGVEYPMEANVLRLRERGVVLTPMKMVYINYNLPPSPDKPERERTLTGLNADERVLFAFKEYPV